MEAIAYLLSKFSTEIIALQVAMVSFFVSIGTYWLIVRKKRQQSAEWVPAALVKAYLDRVDAEERDIRYKLFGEVGKASVQPSASGAVGSPGTAPVQQIIVQGADPAVMKELEALRGQLSVADQRALEFDKLINSLKAEKMGLEQKLKDAQNSTSTSAGAAVPGDVAKVQKELEEFKAKLAEYEVIEDDLANLKKYQQENKTLKDRIESLEKGGGASTVAAGTQAESLTKVSGASTLSMSTDSVLSGGPPASATPTVVSGSNAPVASSTTTVSGAAPASKPELKVVDSGASAPAASVPAPSEATTPAAAAPAAEAAGGEKSAKQKEDELLSEFEKMLAS